MDTGTGMTYGPQDFPELKRLRRPVGAIEDWLEQDAAFGVLLTDGRLVIRYCNQWLRRRKRPAGGDLAGTPLLAAFPELRERRLEHYYRQALNGQLQILSQRFHHYLLALPADPPEGPGALMFQTARIYPVREDDAIAGTLTVLEDVTERVRTETVLRRKTAVSQSMADLSQALISTATFEDISHLVLRMAQELTESTSGFTGYIDGSTGRLVSPTLSRTSWDICRIKEKTVVFERFTGLWGWVLNNRRPLLANDAAADPRSTGLPAGHPPVRNFLSAPALFEDRLVGQVAVANSPRDYTDEDLHLVRRLADLYALAISRRLMENRLHELSITDELTGLYNRRGFMTLAEQQVRIAGRTRKGLLIVFIDLDGLKWINDVLGHPEGDRALRDTADLLRGTFRESDIIARVGGDEFAVLALEAAPAEGEILERHLREGVAGRNAAADRPYRLSLSVGTACYDPGQPAALDALLGQADLRMYREKEKKRRDAAAIIR